MDMAITTEETNMTVPVNSSTSNEQAELSSSLPTPPIHKTNPQFWHSPTSTTTMRDQVDRRSQTNDTLVTLDDLDHFVFNSTNMLPSSTRSEENDTPLNLNDFTLFDYDYEPIPSSTHLFPPL